MTTQIEYLIVSITCIAFIVDYMLYMSVVPIIPIYFRERHIYEPKTIEVKFNETSNRTLVTYPDEHTWNGLLFSSKAIVHIIVCPFCGEFSDRIGYKKPLLFGLIVISSSTMMFAVFQSYWMLFVARSLQGLGSAFTETSALSMMVKHFTDLNQRTKYIGLAFSCMQFGYLFGPWFGGTLFEFSGKFLPFFFMSLLAVVDIYLTVLLMRDSPPDDVKTDQEMEDQISVWRLLLDRRIACCAGALAVSEVAYTFLAPNIAVWMKDSDTMSHVGESQMGLVWFVAFFPYLAGIQGSVWMMQFAPGQVIDNVFCAEKAWKFAAGGLLLAGFACVAIPLTAFSYLMVGFWFAVISLGIAVVHHCINVILADLVDESYSAVYGSVYAIAEISYNLTYSIGPLTSGWIVHIFNFTILNFIGALIYLIYAPLMSILKVEQGDKINNEKEEETGVSLKGNGELDESKGKASYGATGSD